MTPKQISLRSHGLKLHGNLFFVDAKAPTILLLHTMGFYSFEYEKVAIQLMKKGYNCLALDFHAHGKSEGTPGRWTLQNLIEDATCAIEYIEKNYNGPIGVFGTSFGGVVAVYAAVGRKGKAIKSLAISNCSTYPAGLGSAVAREAFVAIFSFLSKWIPFRVSLNHFVPYTAVLSDRQVIEKLSKDPLISEARKLFASTYREMFSWNATEPAGKVEAPTLVIAGKPGDLLQSYNQSMLLYNALKGEKELRKIDHGHLPHLENPDLVAQILGDWFNRTL